MQRVRFIRLGFLAVQCHFLPASTEVARSSSTISTACAGAGDENTCETVQRDSAEELTATAIQNDPSSQALEMLQRGSAKVLAFADGARDAAEDTADSTLASHSAAKDFASDRVALGTNLSQGSGWQDNRCLKAPEGNACIPDGSDSVENPALWTHYAYCSGVPGNRYRLSSGVSSCDALSRCKMSGSGLSTAQCDDPFCRTREEGKHCYNGNLVFCQGDEEPQNFEYCRDKYETNEFHASDDGEVEIVSCTVTSKYTCQGQHPNPVCGFDGTSQSCDIRRRRDGRRRCPSRSKNDQDDSIRRR